jgi:integrase
MPAYKDADGRWRYRFAFEGKRYSGSAPKGNNTKKAAEQLERLVLEKLRARRFTGIMPTVAGFLARFLDHQKQHTKPLTFELHERICDLHIEPHVGRLRLDQLRRAELDHLKLTWLAAGAAPRTVNTRLGVAVRMLSLAAEWEILESVPKVKLMKIAVDHPRFLSEDEAAALLEAAKKRSRSDEMDWYVMTLVGLRTGLRIGELRGLQWGDVDFDRRLVHVRRTDPGRMDLDANAPKGNRPRIVPLTPDAFAVLHEWHGKSKRVGPKHWVWIGVESWKKQRGRYRTRSEGNCSTAMGRIAKAAGLDDEVTWHTLRHTYASWLVMRGVPLSAVQELLGHASARQTERYAHLAPGFAQHAAVASLDVPLITKAADRQSPPLLTNGPPNRGALPKGDQKPNPDRRKRRRKADQKQGVTPRSTDT